MANKSRSRRSPQRGRSNGKAGGYFFAIILCAAIFSFFQIPADPSVSGIWNIAVSKSATVEAWAKTTAAELLNFKLESNGVPGGSTGGTPVEPVPAPAVPAPAAPAPAPAATEAVTKLNALVVKNADSVAYNRDEWKQWTNVRTCWTTREQVLAEEAVPGSLNMLDKNGAKTTDVNSACEVKGGQWNELYAGKSVTNPSALDIDHMVPLSYAAQHGGQAWSKDKKTAFANDLSYANHLYASDASANRSKSDQGPSEWKPSNTAFLCEYGTAWVTITTNYQLSITAADKVSLAEMLKTC